MSMSDEEEEKGMNLERMKSNKRMCAWSACSNVIEDEFAAYHRTDSGSLSRIRIVFVKIEKVKKRKKKKYVCLMKTEIKHTKSVSRYRCIYV